tara:strand:- start:462 stop:1025 length:564 start_codon:yes stop_codon:yes gene_type:complete
MRHSGVTLIEELPELNQIEQYGNRDEEQRYAMEKSASNKVRKQDNYLPREAGMGSSLTHGGAAMHAHNPIEGYNGYAAPYGQPMPSYNYPMLVQNPYYNVPPPQYSHAAAYYGNTNPQGYPQGYFRENYTDNTPSGGCNCLSCAEHISNCPICKKLYKFNKVPYIIVIVILTLLVLALLARVITFKC